MSDHCPECGMPWSRHARALDLALICPDEMYVRSPRPASGPVDPDPDDRW